MRNQPSASVAQSTASPSPGQAPPLMFRAKGFSMVDNTFQCAASRLSRSGILVYLMLCQYANGRKASAWPGSATLMRQTELSRDTIRRARRELETMGLLDCSARSQVGTILYRLPTLAAAKGTPTEAGGSTADTEGGLTHKGRGGLPISPKEEQSIHNKIPNNEVVLTASPVPITDPAPDPEQDRPLVSVEHATRSVESFLVDEGWTANDRAAIDRERQRDGDDRTFDRWAKVRAARTGLSLDRITGGVA